MGGRERLFFERVDTLNQLRNQSAFFTATCQRCPFSISREHFGNTRMKIVRCCVPCGSSRRQTAQKRMERCRSPFVSSADRISQTRLSWWLLPSFQLVIDSCAMLSVFAMSHLLKLHSSCCKHITSPQFVVGYHKFVKIVLIVNFLGE